ncbi:E3 ubiquitin-protein ligase FANCL-like [Babylonia areolata]|uniref:E3 ubiquitin-protein ligase FANCL-like n=1 Tax=Babylonia areolata TaxID=304850 RepID=UPI003FD317C7
MREIMDGLQSFPCLIPVYKCGTSTVYDGYLSVNGEEYRVRITTPKEDSLEGLRLQGDWRLQCLLREHADILEQRLKQCKDLPVYLKEIEAILACSAEERPASTGSFANTRKIVEEMEKIGWDKLVSVDGSFQHLTLRCGDTRGRQHKLIVHLNAQENVAPQCVADLPGKFVFQWTAKGHLSELMRQLEGSVARYQALWDALDVVDQKTWVLEPDHPSFSACSRRIALSPGTSLQITVDPRHPSAMPECRFLGADQVIAPLKDKLNANLHLWDNQCSLVSNLETLLEITFPSPTNSKKEDFSLECGICYSYRLGDEIPDKTCDDAHCAQPFHQSCLYEWLRSLPSCQQSFNTIFGECPFCSKPISVKLPTK